MSSVTATGQQASVNKVAFRLWAIVVLLMVACMISYFDRINLSFALLDGDFKKAFQFSSSERGLLNSAFFWTYAALQIPAGWVVDRYGSKYPMLFSFVVWSALTAVTASITGFSSLFLIRLLLGVGEAAVQPAAMRWVRVNFPEKHRGLAIGIFMSGTKFGPALGATVAAWLIDAAGWRAMFVLLGLVSMLWIIPFLLLVKNDDKGNGNSVGMANLSSVDIPMGRLLASPILWGTVIGTFCYMYFVYFCLTWMPAYLNEARHLSLGSSGFYTTFSFAGMAIVAIVGGWAADRIIARGHNPVTVRKAFIITGFLLASTELFGAFLPVNWALFVSVLSLSGLGLTTANYWALTQTLIPGKSIGRIIGIQNCAANIPGIVAPLFTGWLLEATGSYVAPMTTVLAFLVVGIFAYLFLVREKYALDAYIPDAKVGADIEPEMAR